MKPTNSIRLKSRRFLLPGALTPYLESFTKSLSGQGYTSLTIRSYTDAISHFATWLQAAGAR